MIYQYLFPEEKEPVPLLYYFYIWHDKDHSISNLIFNLITISHGQFSPIPLFFTIITSFISFIIHPHPPIFSIQPLAILSTLPLPPPLLAAQVEEEVEGAEQLQEPLLFLLTRSV